jgi:branched-chain amino acid transport system substrate-binding protein
MLSGRSPWLFRLPPSDVAASRMVARYVADSMRARRAAIIYRNDSYGRDWTSAFTAAFRERGGEVVQRDPYLGELAEWPAYAAYVAKLRPDVLLFPGSGEDAERVLRALRAAGVTIPFVGGDAVASLAGKPEFAGARYVGFFLADRPPTAEGRAFVAAYAAKFGEPPDMRAAMAYDAAMLIGRAALEAGADRTKVRDWLAGVGSAHAAHAGVTGSIAFDARQDAANRPLVIATVPAGSAARAEGAR